MTQGGGNTFDDASVKRIAEAVRRVERLPPNIGQGPPSSGRRARGPEDYSPYPLFVELNETLAEGEDAEAKVLKYAEDWEESGKTLDVYSLDGNPGQPDGSRGVALSMHGRWWFVPTASVTSHQGKTDGSISAGGSGTVSLYKGTTDTGDNVTAHCSQTVGETIASNTWVDLSWRQAADGTWRWEITGYKCS